MNSIMEKLKVLNSKVIGHVYDTRFSVHDASISSEDRMKAIESISSGLARLFMAVCGLLHKRSEEGRKEVISASEELNAALHGPVFEDCWDSDVANALKSAVEEALAA